MNITVLCDQKDCIYNVANKVHHDHSNDKCTHHKPQIHILPIQGGSKIVCLSKEIFNDNTPDLCCGILEIDNSIPWQCTHCNQTDKDYCTNVCPVTKSK